ncbi:hypothetical protein Tco_1426985, partial [Tanacetum coccineum]
GDTRMDSSLEIVKALDKIRFESLTDKSKLDGQPELVIHIIPDKANWAGVGDENQVSDSKSVLDLTNGSLEDVKEPTNLDICTHGAASLFLQEQAQ